MPHWIFPQNPCQMESRSLKKPMSCRQRGCRCFVVANGKKTEEETWDQTKRHLWGLRIKSREDCNFILSVFRFCESNLCIYRWTEKNAYILLHLLFGVYRNHSLGQATRHEKSDPFTHFIRYIDFHSQPNILEMRLFVPKLMLKQRFVQAFVGLENMSRN